MLSLFKMWYWRITDFVHKDRTLGFSASAGDAHHMSMNWIYDKRRDAAW